MYEFSLYILYVVIACISTLVVVLWRKCRDIDNEDKFDYSQIKFVRFDGSYTEVKEYNVKRHLYAYDAGFAAGFRYDIRMKNSIIHGDALKGFHTGFNDGLLARRRIWEYQQQTVFTYRGDIINVT
tara:strand:- start:216 stop:593 length:378 start_codon:yes stop_codon:yes gene_type:complete